jgi:hypothetical protein
MNLPKLNLDSETPTTTTDSALNKPYMIPLPHVQKIHHRDHGKHEEEKFGKQLKPTVPATQSPHW